VARHSCLRACQSHARVSISVVYFSSRLTSKRRLLPFSIQIHTQKQQHKMILLANNHNNNNLPPPSDEKLQKLTNSSRKQIRYFRVLLIIHVLVTCDFRRMPFHESHRSTTVLTFSILKLNIVYTLPQQWGMAGACYRSTFAWSLNEV